MIDLDVPIRGLAAGFIIAAPVGPVNVLCIQRTIEEGWWPGVVSGTGAAAADAIYGAVAAFSISLVIQFLIREEFWFRLIGGILLVAIGIWYYYRKPPSLNQQRKTSPHSEFTTTFLLTLTNPTTVLSFMAVLATLGMSRQREWWLSAVLVAGIFVGSMAWWITLATIVSRLRTRITDRAMLWTNRIAAFAIGGFGIVNISLAHTR